MRQSKPQTHDPSFQDFSSSSASPTGRVETEFVIKVCGITNLEDAMRSLELGANALGFNFYPHSPRFLDPEKAGVIIRQLPEEVLKVAVVVVQQQVQSPGVKVILDAAGTRPEDPLTKILESGVNAIQIHGLDREREVPSVDRRIFVATSPQGAVHFPGHEIIIDTSWGTGKLADWALVATLDRPFILSGGLTPQNLAEALETLRPAGVDVCSGVESDPGKKDFRKLEAFLTLARSFVDDSGSHRRSQAN